jgi:cytochrome c551/c552
LGDPRVIGTILTRLSRKGTIRRLARGLYDYPRKHDQFGILSPSIDDIAQALKGRDATRLQPSGAYAANLLGLSDQVPMKVLFLTDGPSKHIQLDKQEIILKRTTPRNMATAGRISGLVTQALRHLGQKHADQSVIKKLKRRISDDDKKQLIKDLKYAPAWIADIMRTIAKPNGV